MTRERHVLILLAFLLLTLNAVRSTVAQPAESAPAQSLDGITKEQVDANLKQIEGSQEVDDETKAKVKELYQTVLQQLETIKSTRAAIQNFEGRIASAAEDTEASKREREELPDKAPAVVISANTTATELEQKLLEAKRVLKEREEAYQQLEGEPNRRAARIAEIPKLVQAKQQQLARVEKELASNPGTDEDGLLLEAKRMRQVATRAAIQLEITSLEKERAFYEVTDELIQIQRDIAAKSQAHAKVRSSQWQELWNRQREREAEIEALAAQKKQPAAEDQIELPLAVQKLDESNAELATERAKLSKSITDATDELRTVQESLKRVSTEFNRTREIVDARGLSHESGILLREQRGKLPAVRKHRLNMLERQRTKREVIFNIYRRNNERSDLATLEPHVATYLADLPESRAEELEPAIREKLATRRDYLGKLISDLNDYSNTLSQLNADEEKLIGETNSYTTYINGHVLWIRSAFVLSRSDLAPAAHALAWLGSLENWRRAYGDLVQDAKNHPVIWAVFVILLVPLVYCQRRLRLRISDIGQAASRRGHWHFAPTVEALGLTVLIAVLWPGAMAFVGWRLGRSLYASDFASAVSAAMTATAAIYFSLELLRQLCRRSGVADVHFGLPDSALVLVQRNIRWLMTVALPLLFVTLATDAQTVEPLWSTSLGRVTFIVFLCLFAFFLQRLLRPNGGVFKQLLAYNTSGWLYRLRYAWYPLTVGTPLALAVLAAVGYYETAQMLARHLFETSWLVVGLAVLGAIVNRWILMSRRKQALEQARQRWSAAQNETPSQDPASIAQAREAEQAVVDLATVSEQTKNSVRTLLVLTGILISWLVWSEVIPALTILKTIPFWNATELTLADILLALIALVVTYVATKNVPGLLEFTVLGQLPLDTGARYAITTLSRYLIAVLGLAVVGRTIGITWSSIQWLFAAMGIGLGFGLQEIFANFISGIILLFERPIRVGDIITLGDTSGVVTQIHIRATTVTDWDRKEYIVPNKDLITGRLLNWTLSDKTNRIVIPVGVAYGTDTGVAQQLLLKVAQDHPLILDDPGPIATFEGFGNSTLNLILRCYLPSLENRLGTISELHTAIDKTFKEAGIEIAFPQQDLHIRSISPSPIPLATAASVSSALNSNGAGNSNLN